MLSKCIPYGLQKYWHSGTTIWKFDDWHKIHVKFRKVLLSLSACAKVAFSKKYPTLTYLGVEPVFFLQRDEDFDLV